MKLRWSILLFVAANAALVGQAAYFYPQLPDPVSSHYGVSGAADGWMSKMSFMSCGAGLLLFLSCVFIGLALALPRVPDSLINLPNSDYWLAPVRRPETMRWITDWLLYFETSTLVVIGLVVQSVYRANVDGTHRLGGSIQWLITGFSAFALVQIVGLIRRFAHHPERPLERRRTRRRE